MNAKQLRELADELFRKRGSLLNLWQEIADNFYSERADFTYRRYLGEEFAANLMTSYPLIARREFADQLGAMLRPKEKPWFKMVPADASRENNDAKRWLEWASGTQRRAMYDRDSLFTKATKHADNDYSAFGQFVMSARLNKAADTLLYRTWHLRDCAWQEDEEGKVTFIARRWKPYARDLVQLFGDKAGTRVKQTAEKHPFTEQDCLHIMCQADMYDDDARGRPWFSIYYDCGHDHLIEAVSQWNREYVIPRWLTVSGSQYAYSPATIAALPDARLIQAMTMTLLEAGEKIVNPPLVATTDAVRSDMAVYAGGVTWVDRDYDERLGQALRPMTTDAKGMPLGQDMRDDTRAMIHQAFYLNKLTLPQRAPEMTAYEVGQRIQEYIRGAIPIFEPTEDEYNGAVCELTFDVLLRAGAFGSPDSMPPSLRGADIEFRFESPLHDAIEAQKGQQLLESKALVAEAAALDQSALVMLDAKEALRDALAGIGTPSAWVRSEVDVADIEAAQEAARQNQAALDAMQQGSEIAENLGGAAAAMQ